MNVPNSDPHAVTKVLFAGAPLTSASGVLVAIHGRGASAESMLEFCQEFAGSNLTVVLPQAFNNTWYPLSFLAPLEQNQPSLASALKKIEAVVDDLLAKQIPSNKIALLGFSQGACLTSEFIARNPRSYGAAMMLTGGLIGPVVEANSYAGNLSGTPVFLASSDPDPHVPFSRVLETEKVLAAMGALVEVRRYPNMAHTINQEEVSICHGMISAMAGS